MALEWALAPPAEAVVAMIDESGRGDGRYEEVMWVGEGSRGWSSSRYTIYLSPPRVEAAK